MICLLVLCLSMLPLYDSSNVNENYTTATQEIKATVKKIEAGDLFVLDRDGETHYIKMEDAFKANVKAQIGTKILLTVNDNKDILQIKEVEGQ